ncbi:MAG: hypothetical protein H6Q23_2119 [Bacteroidetes bacterium]|nr:hypothetical protein [Bacteroidota bacterium]
MKRLFKINFSLLILFAFTATEAFAQVSATGHVIAEIIPVFTATETSQLNFGRFSPGPQGGKIILSPQGSVSVLGSIYKGTGMHNAASFYVTGDQDASFSITLPENPVILKHTTSPKTMTIDNWLSVPAPGAGMGSLQNGSQTIYIGATLNVGTLNDNPVGIYTGTYEISFDFN